MTFDGKPYGPERYREIVKERFLISKHTNTSYTDTAFISPTERTYLLRQIMEDLSRRQQIMDQNRKN